MPNRTLLVVDDDAAIRELIRTRLNLAGYNVHTARSGSEAIGRIYEVRPTGLLLDINMPEMDGFEVLRAVRGNQTTQTLPVMMLTARHADDDVKRALKMGASDFLAKPFNEAQLLVRVARLIRPKLAAPPQTDGLYLT